MEVIYGLIPGMLVLGLAAVAVLFWAARSGQFDDLEGDGQRLLLDEAATPAPGPGPAPMASRPIEPNRMHASSGAATIISVITGSA